LVKADLLLATTPCGVRFLSCASLRVVASLLVIVVATLFSRLVMVIIATVQIEVNLKSDYSEDFFLAQREARRTCGVLVEQRSKGACGPMSAF